MSDELEAGYSQGPAMAALTSKQRAFVLAMASDPLATPTEWARAAGYDPNGSDRVAGHNLSRNPKIEAAARELARSNLDTFGPVLGIGVMMMIARNPEHKDQLKAAEKLANRSGFHEVTEQVVTKRDQTGTVMVERIKALAKALGVDAGPLIGINSRDVSRETKLIEAKAE